MKWRERPCEWEPTPKWLVWLGKPPTRRRVLVTVPPNGECLDWWEYEPRPGDGLYHLPD